MPEKWTGELIGKMHNNRINYDEIAAEMGVTKAYISMILNGSRNPEGAQERMEKAVDAIIARRGS
jgi:transcriptional regulator with XRE-family HTH domain